MFGLKKKKERKRRFEEYPIEELNTTLEEAREYQLALSRMPYPDYNEIWKVISVVEHWKLKSKLRVIAVFLQRNLSG